MMIRIYVFCLLVFVLVVLVGIVFVNFIKLVYFQVKDEVKVMFKVECDKCDLMFGNVKDVCQECVKGQEKVVFVNLEYQYIGKEKDCNDYLEVCYDVIYKVVKEMCDDKLGNVKDVCVVEVKVQYDKVKVELKVNKVIVKVEFNVVEVKFEVDYKVVKECCDSLFGDVKDSCQVSVKVCYFQ